MSRPHRRVVGPRPPTLGAGGDYSTLGLAALLAAFGVAAVLWAGAAAGAVFTTGRVPDGGLLPALNALGTPSNPARAWPEPTQLPGPVVYWSATALTCVSLAVASASSMDSSLVA